MKELIYDFYGYNEYFFLIINNLCHKLGIELPLYYVSKIFDIEKFAVYYMMVAIGGWLYYKNKKTYFSIFFDFMMRLGTSYATFGFAYAALKFSVNMARPFCSIPLDKFHTIADISSERCLSSFPSSHTGLVMLLTLVLWPYLCKRGKTISIISIFIVALSRISLAMHYPADILYSLIIAYIIYIISGFIYKLFEKNIFKFVKGIIVG